MRVYKLAEIKGAMQLLRSIHDLSIDFNKPVWTEDDATRNDPSAVKWYQAYEAITGEKPPMLDKQENVLDFGDSFIIRQPRLLLEFSCEGYSLYLPQAYESLLAKQYRMHLNEIRMAVIRHARETGRMTPPEIGDPIDKGMKAIERAAEYERP
jgi:hypothetical protein